MSTKSAADLVGEYLKLGGTRKSLNDDNLTSTRKWDSEPPEAKTFWDREIGTLDAKKRKELETLLPSASSSD